MSVKPYTRQLGARSGVQLNPLKDNTERFVPGNADQVFAVVGRFERGRIDKAFRVNRGNRSAKLGSTASTVVSRLNETAIHVYEAFFNGAYEAVVSRLVPAGAVNSYMVVKDGAAVDTVLTVSSTAPVAPYILAVKHMDCFNDGVTLAVHADEALDDLDAQVASKIVTITLSDKDGTELYSFTGSLDPAAKDEFGSSYYLPNVVSAQTDAVEVTVATNASVATTSMFYGTDVNGDNKVASKHLLYFSEGGTAYINTDYDAACQRLEDSQNDYGYIAGGGTRATALISRLANLGKRINTQFVWDIPGDLTPEAAIAFMAGLNIDSHYSQCYWAPLKTDDPLNGGKDVLGTSAINVGKRCLRNASTDANGVPPKNWVIAGKDHPLERTGIVQTYFPSEQELDDLAKARINPVIFQKYNGGSKFVFLDSLTNAKTNADRKLIAVAEMATTVDDWVATFANECLQLPMLESVKRMNQYLEKLFPALETAKWIKVSEDKTSEIYGLAFAFTVAPNAQRPSDRMDVSYWVHYDGTNRATYVQQTLSK